MKPADTSTEEWRILLDIYRRMTPDEKLQRTLDMSDFMRSVCEAGVREEFPQASEREVFLRVTRRTLGKDLFNKVYGCGALVMNIQSQILKGTAARRGRETSSTCFRHSVRFIGRVSQPRMLDLNGPRILIGESSLYI